MFLLRGRGRNIRIVAFLTLASVVIYLFALDIKKMSRGNDVINDHMFQFPSEYDDPYRIIPRDMLEAKRSNISMQCAEKRTFVYIKMIKCGSTTLSSLFRLYGATKGLSCVLPVDRKIYLGWPYQMKEDFYRPSLTGHYDFLVDHVIYNRSTLSRLIRGSPVYLTSLREPFSQFKSMFNYYNLKNIMRIPNGTNPIREYLYNIEKYEKIYQSRAAAKLRHCIPDNFSMSYNLMSFNLGFPIGWFHGEADKTRDTTFIEGFIKRIDSEFSLVLMTEYMEESLILLKRLMCWKLSDILHINRNVGKYSYKNKREEDLVLRYQARSPVDFILYAHFNRTLWEKIEREGPNFMLEVSQFKTVQQKLNSFCKGKSFKDEYLVIPESKWNSLMHIYHSDCKFLDDEFDSLQFLKDLYNRQTNKSSQARGKISKFC